MSSSSHPDSVPTTLGQFIGQPHVVRLLQVALDAVWTTPDRLPHILLLGPAGLGKTELAKILAKERPAPLHQALGQNFRRGRDVARLLLKTQDRDLVLIDEAHQLSHEAQAQLYRAMTDRQVFLSSRAGPEMLTIPDATILLATTDEYRLTAPLRSRFDVVCHLQPYSVEDLSQIIGRRAAALRWDADPSVFGFLAGRSMGTPRRALHLLGAARRLMLSQNAQKITVECAAEAMKLDGVDSHGLDRNEQRYLDVLTKGGGSLRLGVISARLGLPAATVQTIIEPILIAANLVDKLPSGGRVLTGEGRRHLAVSKVSD